MTAVVHKSEHVAAGVAETVDPAVQNVPVDGYKSPRERLGWQVDGPVGGRDHLETIRVDQLRRRQW